LGDFLAQSESASELCYLQPGINDENSLSSVPFEGYASVAKSKKWMRYFGLSGRQQIFKPLG
jgi:hypothetical protein